MLRLELLGNRIILIWKEKEDLNNELKKGEKSGSVNKFDRDSFIK